MCSWWAASNQLVSPAASSQRKLLSLQAICRGGFLFHRPARKLLRYAGADSVADAFPTTTQLKPPLLRDQLEAAIQSLLEPSIARHGVRAAS